MPIYLFTHITSGETHEVVMRMNDDKVYNGPNGDQHNLWKRVWLKPRMSVDTVNDPFSAKDFVKATNKADSVGSLWDRSKEMSLKRAEKMGTDDPVRQAFYKNYSRRRKGNKHPEQKREDGVKAAKKAGLNVDWGSDD